MSKEKKDKLKIAVAMSPHKSLRDSAGQAGGQKKRIAVAMSGGVDSSVAAKLLVDQGHEVIGIFLHFWKPSYADPRYAESSGEARASAGKGSAENKCCSTGALEDARQVADKIGIPLYTFNFEKIFKKQVVDNFLTEYGAGRTPNPCIRCNKLVKLGFLIKMAKELGFNYVASGHYAKKLKDKLYKAKDKDKDQSYFLYTFSQDELKHLLFPLGDYTKDQVRQMAKKFKLPVAEKKDSQEVCFIPEKSHNEFLKRHLKLKPGPIVILERSASEAIESCGVRNERDSIVPPQMRGPSRMTDSKIIGRHLGLPLYTIGQRKGIEIGGTGPYYAAGMDYKENILYVVKDSNDKSLLSDKLVAKNVNWLDGALPASLKCEAVIRYRHRAVKCQIARISKTASFIVKFKEPQRAVAPGQSVVFYRGAEVLGGGVIK